MDTMTTGRFYVLAGVVVIAAAAAIIGIGTRRSAPTAAPSVPDLPDAPAESAAIEGEVLETIDVPRYTYLRLRTRGGAEEWAAVSTAKVEKGRTVRVVDAMKMTAFQSGALKRTFDTIYFGRIEGTEGAQAGAPANPHADMQGKGAAPHGSTSKGADVAVAKVARAEGPTGRTVAAIYAERTQLAGKTVRVRGTVVKSTPAVFGHTFLHVRDATGSVAQGDADLPVVTDDSPAVGETVVVEGTLAVDKDLGAQVRYDVLLEDAKVIGR